ncbi:MAG: hypothetical protein OXE41_09510 [Gammaproteobacteria bacterium]|nr:hypothetical protein [Gammaproteobacteria bacterium]MCY4219458.1 hypothetical protein [Gammaproteobacteria bacterium]MCY4275611.1 hypothetical protein [Gammaproteobacteria bacterium]
MQIQASRDSLAGFLDNRFAKRLSSSIFSNFTLLLRMSLYPYLANFFVLISGFEDQNATESTQYARRYDTHRQRLFCR